jgi:hypothetical protein
VRELEGFQIFQASFMTPIQLPTLAEKNYTNIEAFGRNNVSDSFVELGHSGLADQLAGG